jgi:LytS/YehU family sensor histidine kinase
MKLLIMSLKYLRDKIKQQDDNSVKQDKKLSKINEIVTLARFNNRNDIDNILSEIKDVLSEYIDVTNNNVEILDDIISSIKQ